MPEASGGSEIDILIETLSKNPWNRAGNSGVCHDAVEIECEDAVRVRLEGWSMHTGLMIRWVAHRHGVADVGRQQVRQHEQRDGTR